MAHELPPLPYAFDALEPHIDAQTMEIHHDKHHAAYVNNLNGALKGHADIEKKSIDELISDLGAVPTEIRTAVRNNDTRTIRARGWFRDDHVVAAPSTTYRRQRPRASVLLAWHRHEPKLTGKVPAMGCEFTECLESCNQPSLHVSRTSAVDDVAFAYS